MLRILKIITIFVIIIGVVTIGLNRVLGEGSITLLEQQRIGNIIYYKINWERYISNLAVTVGSPQELYLDLPQITWTNDVIQNLKIMTNILLIPVNILLYPIKVMAFGSRTWLAIIGLNFTQPTNTTQWLVNLINFLIQMQIPFIQ